MNLAADVPLPGLVGLLPKVGQLGGVDLPKPGKYFATLHDHSRWVAIAIPLYSPPPQMARGGANFGQLGTGPFFGEKTHFAEEPLTENMDLSPSHRQRRKTL